MTASLYPIDGGGKGRGSIVVDGRQLRDVSHDVLAAVLEHNDPPELYMRGGQLVRVRSDEKGRPIVDMLSESQLRHRVSQCCDTVKLTQHGTRDIAPPREVIQNILAAGTWPVPPLEAVTENPTLRPDGTIHAEAGYDVATRLLHLPARGLEVPGIAPIPATGDVVDAVDLLDELLGEFPFAGAADRANCIAALLTPIVRPVIDEPVPLALLDAPEAGSGKGLIAKVIAAVATGRRFPMEPMPIYEDEVRKAITGLLMRGSTIIILDNVDDAIRSPSLAAALTADFWSDRVLGASDIREFPNRATWIATGNNISVGGDLARRCYRIRLDAHMAKPYLRTGFKHEDLLGWTFEHRGELLAALLTLCRSWWAEGQPVTKPPLMLGGFGAWTRLMANILGHADITGFLDNQLEFLETGDTEASEWAAFFIAWRAHFGDSGITVADLTRELEADPQFRAAAPGTISADIGKPSLNRTIGNSLRTRASKRIGNAGFHIEKVGEDRNGLVRWQLHTDRPTEIAIQTALGMTGTTPQTPRNALDLDGTDPADPAPQPPETPTAESQTPRETPDSAPDSAPLTPTEQGQTPDRGVRGVFPLPTHVRGRGGAGPEPTPQTPQTPRGDTEPPEWTDEELLGGPSDA